ncbi:MAG: serine hydrolase [Flavobacteriales bacterium]
MTQKPIRVLTRILVALLLIHFLVEVSGHHYLYNTLAKTVFKGKLGPDILEYKEMPNRLIANSEPEPWPLLPNYGQPSLTLEEEEYHTKNQSVSFVVVHRDSLLFEQYWENFGPDSISNSFSMAKSVVSLLCGIAIDQGRIESVKKPVYWYMPQYETEVGKEITVENLLTMSSGIDFDEDYLNPFTFPAKANYGDNLELLVSKYEPTEKPGVYFNYQSGTTQVLAFLVSGVMRMSLADMASQFVWQKIGAENPALWSLDREGGMEKAFCCINSTARDFARIGKLYKNHGKWNGQQIIDSAYVAASVSKPNTLNEDGTPCEIYGYQWWLGEHEGMDFFFMRGIKGQYVVVVPEKDLIVVRMGRKRDNGSFERAHPDDVYNYLDMGLRMISE